MTLLISLAIIIVLPLIMNKGFKLQGKAMKTVLGLNLFSFFGMLLVSAAAIIFGGPAALAAEAATGAASDATGMGYLAAALATGLSGIGAGIGVASPAAAAIGAMSEDSSIMGKSLIFVALAEGVALYGLLVSFMILGKL